MKIWLVAILILSGCSSKKKDKDFQESLDKPGEVTPEAQVKAPEKLLEKFEVVEKIETKVPTPIDGTKPIIKQVTTKKVEAKQVIKPALPVTFDPPKSKLPKDYPEATVVLNAKAEKTWNNYKPKSFHLITVM